MRFEPVEYMRWAKLRSRAPVNLSRSGVPDLRMEELGIDLAGLEVNGDHPYGYGPLMEAVAGRYGTHPEAVLTTLGTSQAVFLVCAALLEKGAPVYVERPAYEPLRRVPLALGAEVRRFERPFEGGFGVDFEAFEAGFPEGAKLVILTNLHNPSGVLLPPSDIAALADIAAKRGARILIDEVYLEFSTDAPRTSFGLAENILVVSSLTKVFGLSGFRCGWILAPEDVRPALRSVVDHLYVEHVFMAEQLAARAFPHLDRLKNRTRPWIEANRASVRAFIAGEPRLAWIEPDGGLVGFPRVGGGGTGDRLAGILRERWETSVVPGGFFEDGRAIRLGYGVPAAVLDEGLGRLRRALDELP